VNVLRKTSLGRALRHCIGTTIYMLVAIWFEERNLLEFHDEAYAAYRGRTPVLIPFLSKKPSQRNTPPKTRVSAEV
jgi:hypothetical protein